jgi:E3 ubiquitin-protein ligase CCNP1IP1
MRSGMAIIQGSLQRKNEELLQAYREKSRKHIQTQELYDKLKRRAMLGQVQDAASDAVDNIEALAINSRFLDQSGNVERRPSRSFLNPGPQVSSLPQPCIQEDGVTRSMLPPAGGGGTKGPWAAFSSQESNHRMSWFRTEILRSQ